MSEKEVKQKIKEIITYLTNSTSSIVSEENWDYYCEVIDNIEDKLLELYRKCLDNNH